MVRTKLAKQLEQKAVEQAELVDGVGKEVKPEPVPPRVWRPTGPGNPPWDV